MSAFSTKFGMNDVLPNDIPTSASFNPSLYHSTAVGGKSRKMKKCKSRKSRKVSKRQNRKMSRKNKTYSKR